MATASRAFPNLSRNTLRMTIIGSSSCEMSLRQCVISGECPIPLAIPYYGNPDVQKAESSNRHRRMLQTIENRSEARMICEGDVRLYPDGSAGELLARLLDVSNNGFRAMHASAEITPGREFRF